MAICEYDTWLWRSDKSPVMGPGTEVGDPQEGVLVAEPKTRVQKPPMYRVLLLNDDYTPQDFVVLVLKTVFHKEHEDAVRIMLQVHNNGAGTCGLYTREVAETKVDTVVGVARKNQHPLQCVMEKE